jgi:hypothetical protein
VFFDAPPRNCITPVLDLCRTSPYQLFPVGPQSFFVDPFYHFFFIYFFFKVNPKNYFSIGESLYVAIFRYLENLISPEI